MKLIDLHCDTLYQLYKLKSSALGENDRHVDLRKLHRADSLIQTFALFDSKEKYHYNYEHLLSYLDYARELLASHSNQIKPIVSCSEVDAAGLHALLSLEDAGSLRGEIGRIDTLYEKGIRMIALSWNHENSLAYPNSKDAQEMSQGLKPFGIEAVQRMNELGIIVDVSHLSDGGFHDVAKHSDQPFIASHSDARAVKEHPRNLSDAMLRILADRGGVCGINFYAPFLSDDPISRIDAIVRHIEHIRNVAGIDTLAIGSDFDGIDCELEISDISHIEMLYRALKAKQFSDDEIEKIWFRNALRVFGEIIT
ncbi:MAG: dipeptidase [Anaerofustis sp.]